MSIKVFITIILLAQFSWAQEIDSLNANQIFEQQIEGISEKSITTRDYSEIAENLDFIKNNKINLNSATAEELKQLTILNIFQINNFINYRRRNGELLSIYELNSIHGFNKQVALSIMPFVKIAPIKNNSWKIKDLPNILKKVKLIVMSNSGCGKSETTKKLAKYCHNLK